MFSLRLLGGVLLEGPSGPLTGRAVQRRQLALLALLGASREPGVTRDKLVGYLWPETGEDRARRNLSDSLYVLRRALGESAVLATGDVLRLNPEIVQVDVWGLEAAMEQQDLQAAVSLYRGPLLDGFHLGDALEFERWRDEERQRLADRYAAALEGLAERAETAGDYIQAAENWKRLAGHDPYNSRAVVRLMRALAAAGDPANALEYAHMHRDRLRDELGVEPPEDLIDLADQLKREPRPAGTIATELAASPKRPRAKNRSTRISPVASPAEPATGPARGIDVRRQSPWQILLLYVGISWIVFAVIRVIAETVGLPEWLPNLAIVLLVIGLPIVTVTAFVQANVADAVRARAALQDARPGDTDADAPQLSGSEGIRSLFTWRHTIAGGVLAFTLWGIVAVAWFVLVGHTASKRPDGNIGLADDVIAVMPFHLNGPDSLGYLREGLVDMLAAKFTGEGGPRVADPRAVINNLRSRVGALDEPWPRQIALDVARTVGAGRMLSGNAVATPHGLLLNASLVKVATGEEKALLSVDGPVDSLLALVDRFAAQVLLLEGGEPLRRMSKLMSVSLPALRAYLDGRQAYRRGRYEDAHAHFDRALSIDSTFAHAALGQVSTEWWTPGWSGYGARALDIALANRERLPRGDQLMLDGWYLAIRSERSIKTIIDAWAWVTQNVPDSPESWYELGDVLFHWAPLTDYEAPWELAEANFRRALDLDPFFAPAIDHLIELKLSRGDTVEVRTLKDRYVELDSSGDVTDYIRWRVAHALSDSSSLAALRDRIPSMSTASHSRMIGYGILGGFGLADADSVASLMLDRYGDQNFRWSTLFLVQTLAMNRGRPTEALELLTLMEDVRWLPHLSLQHRVLNALYWDGDSLAGIRAAQELEPHARAALEVSGEAMYAQFFDLCVWTLWQLERGNARTAERAAAWLRNATDFSGMHLGASCSELLVAFAAVVEGGADAGERLDRLEEYRLAGPPESRYVSIPYNLILARLLERMGLEERALATVRRRPYVWAWTPPYFSSYLLLEARLAARTGDREGAVRAYEHYLTLRSDPEPSLAEDVAKVRSELASLLAN